MFKVYLKFHPRLLYFLFLVSFARINSKRVAWLECCEYWPPEPCNTKHWSQFSMFVWKYQKFSSWISRNRAYYNISCNLQFITSKISVKWCIATVLFTCKFIRVNPNPFLQEPNFFYLPICNVELLEHLGRCSIDGGYLLQEVVLARAIIAFEAISLVKRSGDPMSQDQAKTSVCKLVSNVSFKKIYSKYMRLKHWMPGQL